MKHVTQRPIAGVLRLRTYGIVAFCSLFNVTETTKSNIYLTAIDTSTVMRVFQSSRLALYSTVTANSKSQPLRRQTAMDIGTHKVYAWTKVIESHGTVVPVIRKSFPNQTSIYAHKRRIDHCSGRYVSVLYLGRKSITIYCFGI